MQHRPRGRLQPPVDLDKAQGIYGSGLVGVVGVLEVPEELALRLGGHLFQVVILSPL